MSKDSLRRSRYAGLIFLVLAALSVTAHLWLIAGTFVPIARGTTVDYLFISATGATLAAIALATLALILGGHLSVRAALLQDAQPALFSWDDVSYVRPLFCFAASALQLLALVPGPVRLPPVVSYLVVDLRWWWTALVLAWLVYAADQRLHGPWRRQFAGVHISGAARRWSLEAALAVIAIAWSALGTPNLRIAGGALGDEPKYVRFCENLYQGLGFDISDIKPMSQLPPDFRPRVWQNVTLLGRTIPAELRALADDAARYMRHPSRRFNRAVALDGGFLVGKNGGIYQVHNPGLSFLMFPAYYIDRRLATIEPGSPAQWPDRLPVVNMFFLGMYALWTVLVFRFLQKCGAQAAHAWIASLAFTLTLPAAAFPYQYYPELAAGLFVSAVGAYILFGNPDRLSAALGCGLLAGYLPWLHVRFIVVTAVFAAGALVLWRGQWRRTLVFLAGLIIPIAIFSLYVYRISGSVMPTALWSAKGSSDLMAPMAQLMAPMIKNAAAYLVDREWGLFAHSPVFLLALPGYWWLARRRPAVAWLNLAVFLALLLPAAGKTVAQTTPMRLIVAVIPFGATPLIDVLARRTRAVYVIFGALLMLSLNTALAYNLHYRRYLHFDTLVDGSFSGWSTNLLLPRESRWPWRISAGNGALLIAWVTALPALIAAPALTGSRRSPGPILTFNLRGSSAPRLALTAVTLIAALGTAVSAATGVWAEPRYRVRPAEAARRAATALDGIPTCTICASSSGGLLEANALLTALEAVDPSVLQRPGAVTRAYREWVAMRDQIRAWYVSARGREPATADIASYMHKWHEEHVPPAEIRELICTHASGRTCE